MKKERNRPWSAANGLPLYGVIKEKKRNGISLGTSLTVSEQCIYYYCQNYRVHMYCAAGLIDAVDADQFLIAARGILLRILDPYRMGATGQNEQCA